MNIVLTIRRAADANVPVTGPFTVEVNYERTVGGDDGEKNLLQSSVRQQLNADLSGSVLLEGAGINTKTLTLAPRQVKRIQKVEWKRNMPNQTPRCKRSAQMCLSTTIPSFPIKEKDLRLDCQPRKLHCQGQEAFRELLRPQMRGRLAP